MQTKKQRQYLKRTAEIILDVIQPLAIKELDYATIDLESSIKCIRTRLNGKTLIIELEARGVRIRRPMRRSQVDVRDVLYADPHFYRKLKQAIEEM